MYAVDMVRLVCDLAYLPHSKAEKLRFDVDYFAQQRKELKKSKSGRPNQRKLAPITESEFKKKPRQSTTLLL